MMRRVALLTVVVTMCAATACIPPPRPLPPGESRPFIESVTVSPTPVVAGEPLRLVVTASDDGLSAALTFEMPRSGFDGPWVGGWWGPSWRSLTAEQTSCGTVDVELIDAHVATATLDCTLPADIPPGEWRTTVTVRDGVENSFWSELVKFQVVSPPDV